MSAEKSPRTALLAGAEGGLERAIQSLFGKRGWEVQLLTGDLEDSEMIASLASDMEKDAPGGLAALVHCGRVMAGKSLADTSLEEWQTQINANLRAPYLLAKALHASLKKRKGAIVLVAPTPANGAVAYAASKGGLLALTRALAIEFEKDAIRVNAVLPGGGDGVAEAVYFLADVETSSQINGQSLVVDGGASARLSSE